MLLLTGDVGGTKTHWGLARVEGGHFDLLAEARYASADFDSLQASLRRFQAEHAQARGAVGLGVGVAGPVQRGRAVVTNLRWAPIDAAALEAELGLPCRVVNDFEAIGFALPGLGDAERVTLQAGRPDRDAPMALLGAGTGLGEALVLPLAGGGAHVVPGEGGHADFAPQTAQEAALLAFLRRRHGHVSWERVLSGAGLAALHTFLSTGGERPEAPDPDPAEVTAAALVGDPTARAAVELFLSLYGAEAGNHALRAVARGGVFLAGGIAPRLLEPLRVSDGPFLRAFRDKGRFATLLDEVPVHVIVDPNVALRGAAAAVAVQTAGPTGGTP